MVLGAFLLGVACVPVDEVQVELELAGAMFYIELDDGKQFLRRYEVATGELTTLFTVPEGGWLAQTAVSPDGSQIALAYSPPPTDEDDVLFANSNLYLMLADGQSEPRPLTTLIKSTEVYFQPVWGSNGRYLYYAHNIPHSDDPFKVRTFVERWDIVTGEQTQLAPDAFWPRPSADGNQFAYVHLNPDSLARSLHVADADGQNGRELIAGTVFEDVDAPLFSSDGTWLYFSAVETIAASQPWWERFTGLQVAYAHDVPSDWWRVPVDGGEPERVTSIEAIGMFGVFNGRLLAFSSTHGIYLLPDDVDTPTLILQTVATNSLSWVVP